MSFEEYLDDAVKFGDTQRTCFTKGYEAGQQSRQAEIDNLKKRIEDALENCYTGIRKQGGDYYLDLVEGILKGDTK